MSILFTKESRIVITCPKFMSAYLSEEVHALGYTITEEWSTGVAIEGTLNDCIKINMNIRTGNQVLWLWSDAMAKNAEELYNHALKLPWEDLLDLDGYISITSNVQNETIDNNLFANVKLKDAIVDRFRHKTDMRPDSGSDRNKTVVHLYWKDDEVAIYLDTSGETLSKHQYRKQPGLAPMQENLAAATILATKWDKNSNFVNPMCGSGTLAIEAAMIALNRIPGLLRSNYGFMHIKGYDDEYYEKLRHEARLAVKKSLDFQIIASDLDPIALHAAKSNAKTAGVDIHMTFRLEDFRETPCPDGKGIVMFNPEYGERLGNYDELELVYKAMGDYMKKEAKGYFGYIFTASPNLAKKVGLKAERKIEFFNSTLECRLLEYELYDGSRRVEKR
ncbi:MAG: class I SAM-dependent RNA methyltransferase [Sphingobacteriales bacterium]|nr:class I SAM-dependent RNA methyltransferase [Sphingobacteriales bacterium]